MTTPSTPGSLPGAIGRYEVLRELGRGAMGVVYEARDPALSRTIALKTILTAPSGEKDSFERRFFEEARIAARLSHPGIVVVHDVGRDPGSGVLYIALEHLRGRTLADVEAEGALDWREVCRLGALIARALHHAHLQGIVHRDMKPANVMVLPSGETKIMDFGIALIETARFRLTNPGEFLGTPLYTAPEQARSAEVDGRTDVFALGTIAYTLLTGRPAFAAARIPDIVDRVLHHDPPAPSRIVPAIPEDVDRVVGRAMAKEREHRYPDADAFAEDLEAVRAGRPPLLASESARLAAVDTWSLPRTEAPGGYELVEAPSDLLESELHALVDGGTGTVAEGPVSGPPAGGAAEPVPAAPPGPVRPSSPAPEARPRLLYVAAALLLVGFGIGLGHMAVGFRDAPESLPPPATAPSMDAPASPTPVAPDPDPPASPPPAGPAGAPAPGPAASRAAAAPGRLRIVFRHPFRQVSLRVLLDGKPVIEEDLAGTVSKKAVVFKMAKGRFQEQLEVSPGVHRIRVEVAWEDDRKVEEIAGTFRPGQVRILDVDVGRLRKGLDVDWR